MAYDLQEQEQLDELRDFWKKYGNFIMTVITVVMVAVAAWRGWGWWEFRQSGQAAQVYDQLRKAADDRDIGKVKEFAGVIFSDFNRTPYAQMAALVAARAYFDADDLKAAKAPLQWAIDNGADEEFRSAARLRMAGILLDEKAYDAGLKVLESAATSGPFAGLNADRRGDLLVGLGKIEEARQAYKSALELLGDASPLYRIVKIKADSLDGNGS